MQTLYIKNLTLAYPHKIIFSKIDLTLPAGKWIAIIGKSGIGKSSLLRVIAGLSTQDSIITGNIFFKNDDFHQPKIAYMPQQDLLFPWLNVLNNACIKSKLFNLDKKQIFNQAKKLLEQVGLKENLNAYPHELSGGMRQRVALVRTLVQDASIILMDEAFQSLDTITRYQLHHLAYAYLENKTVLFVTHDPDEALKLANEIYIMHNNPAKLQHMATLHDPAPRDLNHPDILQIKENIFSVLTNGKLK